jgi:hypothetical protein
VHADPQAHVAPPGRDVRDRELWLARLRAFVAAGPAAPPDPAALLRPGPAGVADVLLPLVARRNLKRLLVASLRLRGDPAALAEWDRLVAALLALPDSALAALLVRPEVTALVAGAADSPDDVPGLLPWLGRAVVGAVAARGGDLGPTRVARGTARSVALPAAGVVAALAPGRGDVVATVRAGEVTLDEAATWSPQPGLAGTVGVSTGRDAWLDRTFPGVEQVAELGAGVDAFVRGLTAAAALLREVWPEAHAEVLSLLRWVVPLSTLDSWYVPGMHGLVALGVGSGRRQVRDLFHETIHHKLSRTLELFSATRNPEHRVRSPFVRELQPVTSVLQSCWAFAREWALIQRLKAHGALAPAEVAGEERKFRAFLGKAVPLLRREADLTPLGDAVLAGAEEATR